MMKALWNRVSLKGNLRRHRGARLRAGRTWAAAESGQALYEFAIVAIPLSLLIVGIIKFGILFDQYVTLTDATDTGARTLAVNRGAGTGPPTACTMAETALDNAATTLTTSQISFSTSFPSPDTSTCSALVAGDEATVEATYPCNLQILFLNLWPSCQLVAETTVRIE
jgi:Flp pilus assembly protein TadG